MSKQARSWWWVLLCAAALPQSLMAAADSALLYADCAACHGRDGGGVADGSIPAIGGQPAAIIERQLNAFRAARREDLRMQHFSDPEHLPDAAAVRAVALYVASLQRSTPTGLGPGGDLAPAAARYASACASCHGSSAAANTLIGAPWLAGQHYGYLLGKLDEAANGRSHLAASHRRLLQRSSGAERAALADYLARLPWVK